MAKILIPFSLLTGLAPVIMYQLSGVKRLDNNIYKTSHGLIIETHSATTTPMAKKQFMTMTITRSSGKTEIRRATLMVFKKNDDAELGCPASSNMLFHPVDFLSVIRNSRRLFRSRRVVRYVERGQRDETPAVCLPVILGEEVILSR